MFLSRFLVMFAGFCVGGRMVAVAGTEEGEAHIGFKPAIDTNLVLANGCFNNFSLCRQLVSNRG